MLHNNLKSIALKLSTKLVSPGVGRMQYAYVKVIQQLGLDVRSWFSREGGNDPGSIWTMGYGPIFPRPTGKEHWGSLGFRGVAHNGKYSCGWYSSTLFLKLDQQELREQLDTAGYRNRKRAGYTGFHIRIHRIRGWTRIHSRRQDTAKYRIRGWTTGYTAKQQDTWLDYRIHSQTAGCVAGLQDTQPNSRIRGWTTGDTARYGIRGHSTAAAPYSSRDERQTYSSITDAKTLLQFAFSSYNRNRRK